MKERKVFQKIYNLYVTKYLPLTPTQCSKWTKYKISYATVCLPGCSYVTDFVWLYPMQICYGSHMQICLNVY